MPRARVAHQVRLQHRGEDPYFGQLVPKLSGQDLRHPVNEEFRKRTNDKPGGIRLGNRVLRRLTDLDREELRAPALVAA